MKELMSSNENSCFWDSILLILFLHFSGKITFWLLNLIIPNQNEVWLTKWMNICSWYFTDIHVYLLRSSRISWKSAALIVRNSQEKECISFVFYCFENLSTAVTLEPLVRFRWGFQLKVPLLMRTSIKWKLKMSHVRLPTDFSRSHHIFSDLCSM